MYEDIQEMPQNLSHIFALFNCPQRIGGTNKEETNFLALNQLKLLQLKL